MCFAIQHAKYANVLFCANAISFYYPVRSFWAIGSLSSMKSVKKRQYNCFIAFTSNLACILLYSMLNMAMYYFVLMPSHSTIQAGNFELLGASLAWKALKSVKYNFPHCQANWGNAKYIVPSSLCQPMSSFAGPLPPLSANVSIF